MSLVVEVCVCGHPHFDHADVDERTCLVRVGPPVGPLLGYCPCMAYRQHADDPLATLTRIYRSSSASAREQLREIVADPALTPDEFRAAVAAAEALDAAGEAAAERAFDEVDAADEA